MKAQVGWLREHVALPESAAEVGRRLTSLGFALDGLEGDGDAAVLEVDVGSNRGDALSHLGLARELAASLGRELRLPPSAPPESGDDVASVASVTVEAPDLCPRYCARVVRGVSLRESPSWMTSRLLACGIRPINVIVDVTNYVLLELGHPLHAFDLDRLGGRRIVVRRARAGERLTTLDGVDRALDPEMLLIADERDGVALAGVMGGATSEIGGATRDVLIESAVFAPPTIRRTSRVTGLHTEASHRFERGCDREMAPHAADRAARLLAELAGGTVLRGLIDVAAPAPPPREPAMRFARARLLTGIDIPPAECERILGALGFERVRADAATLTVRVPSWRNDVATEVDLIEEVLRHHGFDRVPESLPAFSAGAQPRQPRERGLRKVREALVASGHLEAAHFTFDDPAAQRRWAWSLGVGAADRLVELSNPMAENVSVMRVSLVPALLRSLASAVRRGEDDVRLFEAGPVFLTPPAGSAADALAEERRVVAIVATGAAGARHFLHAPRPMDVLAVEGALLEALASGGADRAALQVVPAEVERCAPGAAEIRLAGRRIGWVGRVHPDETAALEIDAPVFAGEADLAEVVAAGPRRPAQAPVSRFPKVVRDVSVLVDRNRALGDIVNAVTAFRGSQGTDADLVESFELIDRYLGQGVPEGQVSLTFKVTYRRQDRTLTQDEVDELHAALVGVLAKEAGATLRT